MRKIRTKKVTNEEYDAIVKAAEPWTILGVEKDSLPQCIQGYPPEKIHMIAASGSVIPIDTEYGKEVGGIDVFRNAEDDPVNFNKDHYVIVLDSRTNEKRLFGPIRDSEHWIDSIPSRFDDIEVIIRINRDDCQKKQ